MSKVTSILPKRLRPYAKALLPAISGAGLLAINAAFGQPVSVNEWKAVAVLAFTTVLTFLVPNES